MARLRPPPEDADPLYRLMKDKVHVLHRIAVCQIKADLLVTGRLLKPGDVNTLAKAASAEAREVRTEFYLRKRYFDQHKPRWVHEHQLLDVQSEKALLTEQAAKLELLKAELKRAQIWAAG